MRPLLAIVSPGAPSWTADTIEREWRGLVHPGRSGDQPSSPDLGRVPHPQALHDRPRARVVDLGEGDDLFDAHKGKGEIQTGAPDLGRVTAAPGLLAQRPADLHALGALDDGYGQPARGGRRSSYRTPATCLTRDPPKNAPSPRRTAAPPPCSIAPRATVRCPRLGGAPRAPPRAVRRSGPDADARSDTRRYG